MTTSTNGSPASAARRTPPAPYKGLVPYGDADYALFFGRDAERSIIIANLRSSRFTLLYGPSGVGKSSVVCAGVVHHLRERAKQNLQKRGAPEFAVVYFNQWRDNPVKGLLAAVAEAVATLRGKKFEDDVAAQARSLDEQLKTWAERVGGDLLILLDQFEDYFLYHPSEDGPGTFAYEFPRIVTDARARVNFVISIREDALAKLDRFEGRIPTLFDNYIRIDHLDRDAARDAIVKPIEQYNKSVGAPDAQVSIEPGLVDAVLDQVKTGRVSLAETGIGAVRDLDSANGHGNAEDRIETPFLQLVMTRLWEEETGPGAARPYTLRLETLKRLGGAERIVRTHLDKTMGALPANERAAAAGMFHYLVTPSGAKIAHTARDLAEYTGNQEKQLMRVLEKMSASGIRILRPVAPPPDHLDAPTRYEIFHDVLAPAMLDWRRRYLQQRRNRMVYFSIGALVVGVLLVIGALLFNLQQSQQQLEQKAQEAQSLSEAILTSQPTGQANVPPTFVALRATAAAVGTSAAALICQGAPSIKFTASKQEIALGETVYLQWSNAQRVSDVSIEPGLGKVSIEGSQAVQPTATTKYTLTAEGCGGKTTQTVTIQVILPTAPPAPTEPPPSPVPPTAVPPTVTNIPPSPTRVFASPTAAPLPTLDIPPGIYVSKLRVTPEQPRAGDTMRFTANFLNTTGRAQSYEWCVDMFLPDDVSRSVGISSCQQQEIPQGESELSGVIWNIQRIGSCTRYLGKAIFRDSSRARFDFLQPDGNLFYLNFTVCP
ncbi:MAG: ATP-binding protein [Chloroflexi bacterium]|nr:ATP-binding protein [Chloroflexota bacterium]